ncbi:MAG: T9SS type A sorting domain-containing protein [Candidatus Fermentibacteraceae bacterium]
MTGACFDSNFIYILGTNYSGAPVVARFTTAGAVSSYMTLFPGLGTGYHDVAFLSGGGVWIARDNADSPIIAYNTSGAVTGYIEGSVISAARGLAIDSEGHIWASNPDNDMIYQIDVITGTAEGHSSSITPRTLTLSENPFAGSVLITGSGFSDAHIQVFDVFGRTVESAPFSHSYLWNAQSVSPGIYFARVSDSSETLVTRLVKTAGTR